MPITNIPSTPATLARDMPGADIRPFDIPAAWDAATLQHDDSWIIRLTKNAITNRNSSTRSPSASRR